MATDWKKKGNSAATGASKGAAIGSIIPGVGTLAGAIGGGLLGGLFGGGESDADRAMAEIEKNKELWGGLTTPDLKWEHYSPEDYLSAGEYNPEDAQSSLISEDPMTRSAQMSALQKMAGLADSGMSEQDALSRQQMIRTAGREAKSATDSALESARSRGVGGSGLEFALREMASQNAADRAQDAGLQGAAQSAQQRALYNQAYLSGLGSQRDQDYRAQSANAGILNQFNMANTQAKNQAAQSNLENRQALQNMNTQGRNNAFQYNQTGRMNTQQQNLGNQVTKLNGMTGANSQMAQGFAAKDAASNANNNANMDLLMKTFGPKKEEQKKVGV
jgi:hypothetical protein